MCKIDAATTQSTLKETPPFSKINTALLMVISINNTVNWSAEPRFGNLLPDSPPYIKSNISALELAIDIVTNTREDVIYKILLHLLCKYVAL